MLCGEGMAGAVYVKDFGKDKEELLQSSGRDRRHGITCDEGSCAGTGALGREYRGDFVRK